MATESSTRTRRFPWVTLILACTLLAIVGFAYSAFIKSARWAKHSADAALSALPDIAGKFKTGAITQTFTEQIPEVSSTRGDVLELAISQNDETFTRSDARSIFWDTIYLGTTVSEIRVPVTFRYHLRLSDPWRLAAKDTVCLVLAPQIRPSLPPAIHTDQMEKSTANGWARSNKDENLAELERGLTPELEQRAGDEKHIALVREACRQSVAEFVKKWLMKEDQWRQDRFTSIVVLFPDEATIHSEQELEQYPYKPTIKPE